MRGVEGQGDRRGRRRAGRCGRATPRGAPPAGALSRRPRPVPPSVPPPPRPVHAAMDAQAPPSNLAATPCTPTYNTSAAYPSKCGISVLLMHPSNSTGNRLKKSTGRENVFCKNKMEERELTSNSLLGSRSSKTWPPAKSRGRGRRQQLHVDCRQQQPGQVTIISSSLPPRCHSCGAESSSCRPQPLPTNLPIDLDPETSGIVRQDLRKKSFTLLVKMSTSTPTKET